MDRRTFFKTLAAGGLTFLASNSHGMKLFPNPGKQKWAILFGSRYGSTRDASLWISEGMGGIADVLDARENPDLSSFEAIIIGSGIYLGRIDQVLQSYLEKNADSISGRIKSLFLVCGSGGTPRAQGYIEPFAKLCRVSSPLANTFPGRITKRLLNEEDYKVEEGVFKKRNQPFEDYDDLKRGDCLKLGEDILRKS